MKAEGIGNKVFLITILCVALAFFLYLRPRLFAPEPPPSIADRLPVGEFIGTYKLVTMAEELNGIAFENKLPFREFFTSDFVLTQAKNYGLDLQSNAYFYGNRSNEFGTIVKLIDSSQIQSGLRRLSQFFKLRDTVIFKEKATILGKTGVYIYHTKNLLFVYKGSKFKYRMAKFLFAKKDEVEEAWTNFNKQNCFSNRSLSVYFASKDLSEVGFDYALFSYKSDTSNVQVLSNFHAFYDTKLKLKESLFGQEEKNAKKNMEVHLDVSQFVLDKKHPFYTWLLRKSGKVGFPLVTFMETWSGDLSYSEGGMQLVNEEFVEMGYDDEFNPIETKKIKQVPINGFSVFMGTNTSPDKLLNRLFAKGILTQQNGSYYCLFSPPLNLIQASNYISLNTQKAKIKQKYANGIHGKWMYENLPFEFVIDSITQRNIYSKLIFNGGKALKKLQQLN